MKADELVTILNAVELEVMRARREPRLSREAKKWSEGYEAGLRRAYMILRDSSGFARTTAPAVLQPQAEASK